MSQKSTFMKSESASHNSYADNNTDKRIHSVGHFAQHSSDAISRVEVPHYERTFKGEIEYTVAIDVQNFPPENIKVSVVDRLVTLEARLASSQQGNSKSFRHEIMLPDRVDPKQIRSVYRKDGHLVLRSPLLPGARPLTPSSPLLDRSNRHTTPVSPASPNRHFFTEDNFSFRSNKDRFSASAFAHSPHLLEERVSSGRNSPLPHGGSFPVPLRRSSTPCAMEKYIKELHINPLFNSHDLMITVRDGVIYVSAKMDDGNKSIEYNSENPIPSNVDASKLTAKLSHGTLTLQASYIEHDLPSYTPIEIQISNDL